MKKSIAILLVVIFMLFCVQSIALAEEAPPEAVIEELPAENIPIAEEAAEPAEAISPPPDGDLQSKDIAPDIAQQFRDRHNGLSSPQRYTLPAPEPALALLIDETTLQVLWGKVQGAVGYYIYCWNENYDDGWIAGAFYNDLLYANHSNLTTGRKYNYEIAAIDSESYLGYSTYASNIPRKKIAAPNNFKAVSNGYDSVKLSWTGVLGATKYYVAAWIGDDPVNIFPVEKGENPYVVKGLLTGKKYDFYIYAMDTLGDTGKSTNPVSATPQVAKPASIKATAQTGLTAGKTYYYKIVPYRTVDGSKLKGGTSAVVSAKAKA